MLSQDAGGEVGSSTLNNGIVGKIYFSKMISSLGEEIIGTNRKRLVGRDKFPPKSYHFLAQIARIPGVLKKFPMMPFHNVIESLCGDSDVIFDT